MTKRELAVLTLCTGLALTTAGCTEAGDDAAGMDNENAGAVADPGPAHEFRLDSERSDPGEFILVEDEDRLHITTGPAGIAYDPGDRVDSGDFQVEATFHQTGAPVGYREAYGLFVGGRDLDSPDQEYTYLLIRGTGDFLIKRRRGETTETIVDWKPSSAVVSVTEEITEPENHLAITSLGGETVFVINGVAVHGMPTPEARPYGITGIRVNHRLDMSIRDWSLGSPPRPDSGGTD